MPKNFWNFRKSDVYDAQVDFWRPCRGLSPGKGFAPIKAIHHMTRRAFLAIRVIQRQGELSFNMLVKKWEKLMIKMKISQNLWIRLTSDQFFPNREAKTYPGMQVSCPSMRFRKIPLAGCVRSWCRKMTEIFGKVTSTTCKSNFGGPAGGSALERASPPTGRGKLKKKKLLR